ncbi:unnamed protein product, partial [Brachionus calyciflorus]
ALAGHLLGAQNIPIYKGSWTEYIHKKEIEDEARIVKD